MKKQLPEETIVRGLQPVGTVTYSVMCREGLSEDVVIASDRKHQKQVKVCDEGGPMTAFYRVEWYRKQYTKPTDPSICTHKEDGKVRYDKIFFNRKQALAYYNQLPRR